MGAADGVLLAILVVVAAIATRVDLERRVIPNRLTAAGAIAAVAAGTVLDPGGELTRLAWGAGAAGFLAVPALVDPGGMGMGDAKLAGVIGLCLGPPVAVALVSACALGLGYGVWVLRQQGVRAARAATFPFGPCLAAGSVAGAAAAIVIT
jgi:leader peptidase (prepilin peptidase)/N-methyltransferase